MFYHCGVWLYHIAAFFTNLFIKNLQIGTLKISGICGRIVLSESVYITKGKITEILTKGGL